VVIIGSDCYDLTPKIIETSFIQLEENDVVVGPATDGGYYLLGMKEYLPQFFENKEFGTDHVLKELLSEAEDLGLSVYQLPTLNDIDTLKDLKDADLDWESLGDDDGMGGMEEEAY
jgi:glycosyltransferase A (GT-A) superfamily protein (DUF2064 family)